MRWVLFGREGFVAKIPTPAYRVTRCLIVEREMVIRYPCDKARAGREINIRCAINFYKLRFGDLIGTAGSQVSNFKCNRIWRIFIAINVRQWRVTKKMRCAIAKIPIRNLTIADW
jgi:hypothetical protein